DLWLVATQAALVGAYWRAPSEAHEASAAHGVLDDAVRQLREYFAGARTTFELPLAPTGTVFQRRVWTALEQLSFGQVASYTEIARRIGAPRAVRAVGNANGKNPLSIIVPCHRVIGDDGALRGYAGGTTAKAWLLAHEAAKGANVAEVANVANV